MSRQVRRQTVRVPSGLRMRWLLAGVLVVAMGSAGCVHFKDWMHNGFKVGPNYMRPAAPLADDWIDFNDPRVISDSVGVDDGAWWRSLNDPNIEPLVQAAYSQNISLRSAGMRVLQAQAQRAIAAGLLFPQLQEAAGTYQHIQISRNGNPGGFNPPVRAFDLWTTGFNVGWELDVWGRFRRNVESADANLDASIEDYDDILVCLIAETVSAYVDLRTFEQRLAYARDNIAAQQDSVRIAQAKLNAGAGEEIDVAEATSLLRDTESLVPRLEALRRNANNRLCILLGTPPRDLSLELGLGSIPAADSAVVVGIPAELLRRRPDIRRAERQVAEQSPLIGVAVADLFPTFSINGSLRWQANNLNDLFAAGSDGGVLAPGFNWNILNYGRIMNNVRFEDARFQELALAYQQTVLEANREVEDAIVDFLRGQEELVKLDDSVDFTKRAVELVRIKYDNGAADQDRVNNRLRDLAVRQDQLATAQGNVIQSLIRLYKGLGGGWQIRYDYPAGDGFVMPLEAGLPGPPPEEVTEELVTPAVNPPAPPAIQ